MRLSAVDLGDEVDVNSLVKSFGVNPPASWEDPVVLIHSGRKVRVYGFGAVVGEMSPSQLMEAVSSVLRFTASGKPGDVEELDLEEDLGMKAVGDDAIDVIAFALAQSVSLSRMEKVMDRIEEEVERVLTAKRLSGKRALKVAKELMRTRHQLISDIMILEKPSITWEREDLEEVYERVAKYLELGRRYRIMDKRLQSSFETVQLLLSLSSEARGNMLELLIVLLIVAEIVLWLFELL